MKIDKIPTVAECNSAFKTAYADAMREGSEEKMVKALEVHSEGICKAMLNEYQQMNVDDLANREILATRGIRQLTSAETKYYKELAAAMRASSANAKIALSDISVTMPETVIDQVMEDVKNEFELLDAIDFVNSSYMTTWIYNKQGTQTATWGAIGSAITKELAVAFGKVSATTCKLSAFLVVSQDYLDLGPAWLDRYVRAILTESAGVAMEVAIVDSPGNADGAACPIGMTRNLEKGTTSGDLTTYPKKTATKVSDLSPVTYGAILAKLSKTPTGRNRRVGEVILVCNPEDYFTKVMPATTYMTPNGGYVSNVLPYPTKVIQSEGCPKGTAVVGLAKQYIGLLGAGSKHGVISYDDSVQFLEDNRVYKIRLLGNGKPKDNSSFEVLDISALNPLSFFVGTNPVATEG